MRNYSPEYVLRNCASAFSYILLMLGHVTFMAMAVAMLPFSLTATSLPYIRSEQGKVAELRAELQAGGKKDKNHSAKKIALKRIVANMTMSNNDMVALFPDIVSCMHIPSLEIKKM